MKSNQRKSRKGATIILMLLLLTLVFVFVAFAVDIGRVQLAQLKLQTAADLAARAGSEAMSRGIADSEDMQDFEDAIRDECDMIMEMNQLFGKPITLDANAQISFGVAVEQPVSPGNGKGKALGKNKKMKFNKQDKMTLLTNSVNVNPDIRQFPMVFGGFTSVNHVELRAMATSMILDRDIVLVVDKSSSMMDQSGGLIPFSEYPPELYAVEDALYRTGDAYHPSGVYGSKKRTPPRTTEFSLVGGDLLLTKMQALKLAIYRFREAIDATPANEKLGLTGYSNFSDLPDVAPDPPKTVDIFKGLSTNIFNAIVTDGICDNFATPNSPTEAIAAALEDKTTNYDKFDFNYLKMRWDGSTNIVDGIEVGTQILSDPATMRPAAQPIMIVLTDGFHNTTRPGNAATPVIAAQNAVAAIPDLKLYTVTFGSGANQTQMIEVANAGNGNHFHAADAQSLVSLFEELASNAGVQMIE